MKVRCDYCGAEFEVIEGLTFVSCPYCGNVIGKKAEVSFVQLGNVDPFGAVLSYVRGAFGVPEDFAERVTFVSKKLLWVPFYLCWYKVVGEKRGIKIEESGILTIPAVKEKPGVWMRRYPLCFSLRGGEAPNGKILKPQIKKTEVSTDEIMLESYKWRGVRITERKIEVREMFYYPVWEVEYEYKGKKFKGYVDGATGNVIKVFYPVSVKGRAFAGTIAVASLLAIFLAFMVTKTILSLFLLVPWYLQGKRLLSAALGKAFVETESRTPEDYVVSAGKGRLYAKTRSLAKILKEIFGL